MIFDADDVNYLIEHFSIEQLRHEITHSRKRLDGENDFHWRMVEEDLISIYQLAIAIEEWNEMPITAKAGENIKQRISIESIKARYHLTDYIGQYIKLRKVGNKFQGLCPFHADKKHPSFFVYPDEHYHCFGCLKSGDIISFVMEYDHVDIKNALQKLAN